MSGIVSGIDYSLLYSGVSSSGAASDILATLYSGASSATGSSTATSTGNPVLDLQLAQKNQTKDVAQQAKNPTVVRALAAFTQGIASAKTLNDALQNPAVLNVLLTANGLGDQTAYTALASKVLQSNPSDPNSLVNQLSDSRWLSVVQQYNLGKNGIAELQKPAVQAQIASAFENVSWLSGLDQATPGLAEALEFKQQASSITSVDQILGDPINWSVVLTALNIPQQIAYQDTSAQEQAVSSRLNIKDLQNPSFVNSLTDQYLLTLQQQNQSTSSTDLTALAVQAGGIVV